MLLSLATGACHDLAIAPYKGKGTGETTLLRRLPTATPSNPATWFWPTPCSTTTSWRVNCTSGIDLVARVTCATCGQESNETKQPRRRPSVPGSGHQPRGLCEQYRAYPAPTLLMREVAVDTRQKQPGQAIQSRNHDPRRSDRWRAKSAVYERVVRELDLRSIKSTMQMDILRYKVRPRWSRKRSGRTCWHTIYPARSWPWPLAN